MRKKSSSFAYQNNLSDQMRKKSSSFAYQNNLRTSDFAYHMVNLLVVWLMENMRSDEKIK